MSLFPSDHFLRAVARLLGELVRRTKAIFNEGYQLPHHFGEVQVPKEGAQGEMFSLEEKLVLFKALLIRCLGRFMSTLYLLVTRNHA